MVKQGYSMKYPNTDIAEVIHVVWRNGYLHEVVAETAKGQRIALPITSFARHQFAGPGNDPLGTVTLGIHGFRVREEVDDE